MSILEDLHEGTIEQLEARLEKAETALNKINDIRNSIVGLQTINWSEHIYPLVAALNEAGLQGLHYPEARKYFGTMLERTVASEAHVELLRGALIDCGIALIKGENVQEALHKRQTALQSTPNYDRIRKLEEVATQGNKLIKSATYNSTGVFVPEVEFNNMANAIARLYGEKEGKSC